MAVPEGTHPYALEKGLTDKGLQVIGSPVPMMVFHDIGVVVVSAADLEAAAVFFPVPECQGGVDIGIIEGGVSAEGETVRGEIAEELERILLVEAVGYTQVGVGEASAAAGIGAVLRKQAQDPVRIRGAGACHEGGFLADGPFNMPPAGEEAYSQGPPDPVAVPFFGIYAEHRRDPAAVLRRNGALVQFHARDDIRVEGGEHAKEMAGVVDGVLVEQHQVLVGRAATHVQAAGGFSNTFDTRQGKHRLDNVSLAEGRRHLAGRSHAHGFHADGRAPVLPHALGRHQGGLEHGYPVGHDHVEFSAGMEDHPKGQVFLALCIEVQDILSHGQRNPVPAPGVAAHIRGRVLVENNRSGQGQATLCLEDGTGNGGPAAPGLSGLANGIHLVAVGGRKDVLGVADAGGIYLFLCEIAVRKAQAGILEDRRGDNALREVMGGMPGIGPQKRTLRGVHLLFQAAFPGAFAQFFQFAAFQGEMLFVPEEERDDLRVEVAVQFAGARQGRWLGERLDVLPGIVQQGGLAVPDQLVKALLGFRISHIPQVHELAPAHGEPGYLVPVRLGAAQVGGSLYHQLHDIGVQVQVNALV